MKDDIQIYFAELLQQAMQMGGTDIHFIPLETNTQVQIRYQGELKNMPRLDKEIYIRICTHIKFLAHLDVSNARIAQSGMFIKFLLNEAITIRASTLPTIFGESLALRLIYRNNARSVRDLSVFPEEPEKILQMMNENVGLYIFSGATGSGKTTTMYTVLQEMMDKQNLNIITLEDPVEMKCEGMIQVQMNFSAGLDYAEGLRAVLRHDPDVILVGEIRDAKTAKLAVRAALTGHRVISTVHAKNSFGTLLRFLNYGLSFTDLEQSIQGVITQALYPLYCKLCKGKCSNSAHPFFARTLTGLYEILDGDLLKQALMDLKHGIRDFNLENNLEMQFKKGVSYGYFKEKYMNTYRCIDTTVFLITIS